MRVRQAETFQLADRAAGGVEALAKILEHVADGARELLGGGVTRRLAMQFLHHVAF
jgi:hypothetical protein